MRIFDGNQKDNFKRKHIVNVIIKKKCFKGDVVRPLSIINLLLECLESMLIFKITNFL
jgi:hypothetical protein